MLCLFGQLEQTTWLLFVGISVILKYTEKHSWTKLNFQKRKRKYSKRLEIEAEKSLLSSCAQKNVQTDSKNPMRQIKDLLQDPQ